jgi:ABC-type polysaccharide/polyol phosphate export permease
MFEKQKLRDADVVTALLLIALGIAVVLGALEMPLSGTYGGLPVTWYSSPAFFPLVLGTALILCSIGVLVRAWRAGGGRRLGRALGSGLSSLPRNRAAHRILTIWGILLGYVLCLGLHPFAGLGGVFEPLSDAPWAAFMIEPEGTNYVISSFLFLAVFMFLFYRPRPKGWTVKTSMLALGVCLLMAWGTGYVFTQHLYSPLPW